MYGMLSEIGDDVVLQMGRSNRCSTALASEGFAIDISLDPSSPSNISKTYAVVSNTREQ